MLAISDAEQAAIMLSNMMMPMILKAVFIRCQLIRELTPVVPLQVGNS